MPGPSSGPRRYRLLKEFARHQLREGFAVPDEYVHEEFPLGEVVLDVVAYPPVERSDEAAIAVECGDREAPIGETRHRFEAALRHVDLLVWFPFTVYCDSVMDVVEGADGRLSVAAGAFDIDNRRFAAIANSMNSEQVCGLIVSEAGRFPWLDEHSRRGKTVHSEQLG